MTKVYFLVGAAVAFLVGGCISAPQNMEPEEELSRFLLPCAESGKVTGSMRRILAKDGTVTYVFTPDCLSKKSEAVSSGSAK